MSEPSHAIAAASLPRRIGQVAVAGAVLAAWMGTVEAALVCLFRDVPEPALFLRQAILGYPLFGATVGLAWGAVVELLTRREGRWRRRAFYLSSLFLLLLLFQLVLHTHLHWTGGKLTPGSTHSLAATAAEAAPVFVLIGILWWVFRRRDSPAGPGPVVRLRSAGLLAVPLLAVAAAPWVVGAFAPPRLASVPNVLMIVLDTTRPDRLSAMGYHRPTTPALERLAADGLVFGKAYAAAPWTLPSHASIFTSEYSTVHNANWEHQFLDDRLPTLAEHLADHGLRTAAFSKQVWLSGETGLMRGFEHFYDMYWRSTTALVAVHRLAEEMLDKLRHREDKGAKLVTRVFKSWIDRHGDEPFFAFINYVEPHAYYRPPVPYRAEFLAGRSTPWGREKDVNVQHYNAGLIDYTDRDLADFSDLYDGSVAYQDQRMGEALDHLRARGLLDRTLVIVTADHGENLGDHNLLGHGFCVYNTLLHVPLVVRLPGVVPAGRVDDIAVENRLLWSLIDLVLWDAGDELPVPAERLASALRVQDDTGGPVLSELYRRAMLKTFWRDAPRLQEHNRRLRALQLNDMKYILGTDGRRELYDLVRDPYEQVNLALGRPDDLAALDALLAAKVAALDAVEGGRPPEFSEELKRRLKSLGYLD